MTLDAAVADYNSGHYIFLPEFEQQWVDLVYRQVTILSRIKPTMATGHPHRYWQQNNIARNAAFVDPQNLNPTVTDTNYGRVEMFAPIKAIQSRLQFSMFNTAVMRQQGVLEKLIAKDEEDWMTDFLLLQNNKLWNGADTSFTAPTSIEYFGILNQIQNTSTVGTGVLIVDAIRTQILIWLLGLTNRHSQLPFI